METEGLLPQFTSTRHLPLIWTRSIHSNLFLTHFL